MPLQDNFEKEPLLRVNTVTIKSQIPDEFQLSHPMKNQSPKMKQKKSIPT